MFSGYLASVSGRAVSVVIPTWNRAEYLSRAIDSVLAQTESPLEILVCDDGSSDNSEAVVASFQSPIVRWMPGPRGGRPAIPRNRGISESRGDWVAFLDDDDTWMPRKVEMQLDAMQRQGTRGSCTSAIVQQTDGAPVGELRSRFHGAVTFSHLAHTNPIVCSSVIVHRSVLEKVGGFPEASHMRAIEDYALWLRVASQTNFANVEEPLVRYLLHPGNSGSLQLVAPWKRRIFVLEDALQWARKSNASGAICRHLSRGLIEARIRERLAPLESVARRVLNYYP